MEDNIEEILTNDTDPDDTWSHASKSQLILHHCFRATKEARY